MIEHSKSLLLDLTAISVLFIYLFQLRGHLIDSICYPNEIFLLLDFFFFFARISGTLICYILKPSLCLPGSHLSSHFISGCLSQRERWLSPLQYGRLGSLIFLKLCQEVSYGFSKQSSSPMILFLSLPS